MNKYKFFERPSLEMLTDALNSLGDDWELIEMGFEEYSRKWHKKGWWALLKRREKNGKT